MGTYAPGPAAGLRQKIVDYVGDGSSDRVVDVGIPAKFYAIFRRIDYNRDSTDLLAFDSVGWTFFQDGGYPYKVNMSFIQGNGINVGKIRAEQGGGNDSGIAFRIIAFA